MNGDTMTMPRHECLRCGHVWLPRIEKKPARCPQCTSKAWNRPPKVARQGGGE